MIKKIVLIGILLSVGVTIGIGVNSALDRRSSAVGLQITQAIYAVTTIAPDGVKSYYYAMDVEESPSSVLLKRLWAGDRGQWRYYPGELSLVRRDFTVIEVKRR